MISEGDMPSPPAVPDEPDEEYYSEEEELQLLQSELPQQYELLGKISQGGMGAIYKDRNRYTKANYAIKILKADLIDDDLALQRFINEAKSAQILRHPNICQVYDFGLTKHNIPYLVMDWIEGISLGEMVHSEKRITALQAIPIFQQIAQALAHAHEHSVVHRDLKPENIMLTVNSQGMLHVNLVDFGIAKVLDDTEMTPQGLTQTGMVMGTPLYMSPEQAQGLTVDGRTDIYCFGCLMYFVVSGKPPFLGANFISTINKHLSEAPPSFPPDLKIPSDLKFLVFKCMEKAPEDRYQNVSEIVDVLDKLLKGQSVSTGKLAADKKSDKKKLITIISFIVGFVITYFLSIGLQNFLDSTDQKKERAKTEHTDKSSAHSASKAK